MKYRYLVLAGALAQAGVAQGMGLGNLDVQSFLGAPLQARLDVLAPRQFSDQDIQVRIARVDVYDRFGVRFEPFHNNIDFSVVQDSSGHIQVRALSSRRVMEPFLDIVVELSWPEGTTYRRYSLLLDPPAYAASRQKASQPLEPAAMQLAAQPAPSRSVSPSPAPARAVRPAIATARPVARVAKPAAAAEPVSGPTYRVQTGDSLWKIARRLQQSQQASSLPVIMEQLYAANPHAFVGGDRNRLMLGAALDTGIAPAGPAIDAASPQQLASNSYDASGYNVSATSLNGAPVDVGASLDINAELASAQRQQWAAVPGTAAELQAAIARLQQEKAELKQFQVQVKTDMTAVLEQRVVVMQAMQTVEQERQQLAPPSSPDQPRQAASLPLDPPVSRVSPASDSTVNDSTAGEATVSDSNTADTAVTALKNLMASHAEGPRLQMSAALNPVDMHPETTPVADPLVSRSGPSLWYLLAMLPLGLLVVLLGMRSQRVQQIRQTDAVKDEDLYELVFGSRRDRSRADSPDQLRQALTQIREKVGFNELSNIAHNAATHDTGHDPLEPHDEMKQMVDLYILYSQYQKALNLILTEISKRPARADLRLYLMQVYAAMGDWKSFDEQLEVVRRMGDAQLLEDAVSLRQSFAPVKR